MKSVGRSRLVRATAVAAALGAGLLIAAPSANATSASSSWNIHSGDKVSINAWHCGLYTNACSWTSSTKLSGSHPKNAVWIENVASLQAHGISASLTISKEPQATLTMVSKSLGRVTWKNTHSWISDNSGLMKPNHTTIYVSTQSCGSAEITSSIRFSQKCVSAGAA